MALFARKPKAAPPAPVDEAPHDVAALEAELDAAMAGDDDARDPAVIRNELYAAQRAASMAADLGTGGSEHVTRKEFDAFKIAVATVFLGLERNLNDSSVRARSVPELIAEVSREIGLSRPQTEEITGLLHVIKKVDRHFGEWDRQTKSAREHAAREAALRRPRW